MTPYYYLLFSYIVLLVLAKLAYSHLATKNKRRTAKKHLAIPYQWLVEQNNRIQLFFNTIFTDLIKFP